MSSRERMLAALNREKPDHAPMAFMIFSDLNKRLNKQRRGGDRVVETALLASRVRRS